MHSSSSSSNPLDLVAQTLGGGIKGEYGLRCKCPAHRDADKSLIVKQSLGGELWFHCTAGCSQESVKAALEGMGYADTNGHTPKPTRPATPTTQQTAPAINAAAWLAQPPTPIESILEGVFDYGDKVVIIGQSKTRKSFFTEQLALALATGTPFLGIHTTGKKRVLLIQSEIRQDQYHWRCIRMCQELGLVADDLAGLWVVNARGAPQLPTLIQARAEETSPEVIIIDPFYKVLAGDENSSEDIKAVLASFDRLAESTGAAVIYVHHDKKGVSGDSQLTDRGSGSGVLARDFDSALFLSPHKNKQDTVLEFISRNYAPKEPITLSWYNYHFAVSSEAPEKATTRTMLQGPKNGLTEHLDLARAVIKDRYFAGYRELGMSSFNAMLEDKGIKYRRLAAVKEELERGGEIAIGTTKSEKGKSNKIVTLLGIHDGGAQTMFENDVGDEL